VSRLAVIAAVAENGVIGRENALPWRLPEDLRHFRRVTMGKPVIMGRKTWDSIGRPLPGRTNIVITRNPAFAAGGAEVVASLDAALALAGRIAAADGAEEVVVIGGAQLYRVSIPRADRLYITEVHASVEGDARLPDIDWSQWREASREDHSGSPGYSFVRYERDGTRRRG
jgi:dihydrofolate reductase